VVVDNALRNKFIFLTKAESIEEILDFAYAARIPQDITEQLLSKTTSCYDGTKFRCGICSACYKRWIAMTANQVYEKYNTPVESGPFFQKHKESEKMKGR
jgi:7-cyano-7-deazaguanine synthase in queuosine biosynthesis